jgi:L-histidine N-alpha-methyltransferase
VNSETRFALLEGGRPRDHRVAMAREVRSGLSRVPRSIPPKYFYDAEGSRLFDAICDLPEYYLTRAEYGLLAKHSEAILASTVATSLVEIGSGMARKTGLLVAAMCRRGGTPTYVPFDIAPDAIASSARSLLRAHSGLRVRGLVGDFARDCRKLDACAPPSGGPRLFAFLGSTIGNLDEREAPRLLRSIADLMTDSDRFLLGIDLVKDACVLQAAYDDSRGVTAAFNKNVLRVLVRELDGMIDERSFEHLALYDEARARIEMHLVSTRAQTITLRAADVHVELDLGERILTEISRKFTRATTEQTLGEGGMQLLDWIVSDDSAFALCLARSAC